MWQTNKHCIIFMLVGGLILAALYLYIASFDPVLADKIAYTGFCFLLFGGGTISWLMAKKGGES